MSFKKLPKYPKTNSTFNQTKRLLESYAWNQLTEAQRKVFKYLWFRMQWKNMAKKKRHKAHWIAINNGEIQVPESQMMKDLKITQQTMTTAIQQLITIGFIELTRYGQYKSTHIYKLLLEPACKENEQKWLKYPNHDWSHLAPRRIKPMINGEHTWKANFKKNKYKD